jgi:hypothetical protein
LAATSRIKRGAIQDDRYLAIAGLAQADNARLEFQQA